jgi:hypothetical protein
MRLTKQSFISHKPPIRVKWTHPMLHTMENKEQVWTLEIASTSILENQVLHFLFFIFTFFLDGEKIS